MKSLPKLNKKVTLSTLNAFNASLLAEIENLDWTEATALGQKSKNLANTTDYKNALFKALDGKTVVVKGYLVNKTNPWNYTVGNASIYVDGVLVDTLQHISIYADLLSNSDLHFGDQVCKGEGVYSLKELTSTLTNNIVNNVSYLNCQKVEFSGVVYSYVTKGKGLTKYSVGTARQVAFASGNN